MPRRRRCWIRLTTPCPSVWRSHRVSGAGSSPAIPRYPKYKLLGDDIELREYILDDDLVLYAIHRDCIHLLTLRHHR